MQSTFLALMLPFLGALAAPSLVRIAGHRAVLGLMLFPAAAFLHFCNVARAIAAGETQTGGYSWIASFNVSFSWYLDGLSVTFALLITGIGTLIVLYAGAYMKGHPQIGRFLCYILLFMGSMLGVVVSDSLLMLFVYWELTSITSFLLIGFDTARPAARRAAMQALIITGGGGLFLLAGLLILWNVTGLTTLSLILLLGDELRQSPFYLAILLLVLMGAFTKSAQFPFHAWLPNAMEAPTPVSAFLHSATMVKAGVYLLMRLAPVMGGTPAWETLLPFFGGVTLVAGALLAIRQTDLKQMLAYTTMASLGLLVLLTGIGTETAIKAAVLYLVAHALFKGGLFMVAGIIDHETGSRDITALSGLRRALPITFCITALLALSMVGLPPAFGFIAKEEVYAAVADGQGTRLLVAATVFLGNVLMAAIAMALAILPFFGRPKWPGDHAHPPHEAPLMLWAGPAVLAVAAIILALLPDLAHHYISSPMASAVMGSPLEIELTLMPHWGLPLILSGFTVLGAVLVLLGLTHLRRLMASVLSFIGWGPNQFFDDCIKALLAFAFHITRLLQSGRLEVYVTTTIVIITMALLLPMTITGEWPALPAFPADIRGEEILVILLAIIGLLSVILARNRLVAIVSLGIQGFSVALLYLMFAAPDLAYTQFMVETLSVVILALVMTRLNLQPSDHRPPLARALDGGLALACGLGFAALLLRMVQEPFDDSLTRFYALLSKTIAHGANVVNVIIVDFRGTDTLGEIAVVLVTGLAILAMIRIRILPKTGQRANRSEDRT